MLPPPAGFFHSQAPNESCKVHNERGNLEMNGVRKKKIVFLNSTWVLASACLDEK